MPRLRGIDITIKCRTTFCPFFIPFTLRKGHNQVAWTCLECGTLNEYAQYITIA